MAESTRCVTRLLLVAEFPGSLRDAEAQDRLDRFREAVQPAQEHDLRLFRPVAEDLRAFDITLNREVPPFPTAVVSDVSPAHQIPCGTRECAESLIGGYRLARPDADCEIVPDRHGFLVRIYDGKETTP